MMITFSSKICHFYVSLFVKRGIISLYFVLWHFILTSLFTHRSLFGSIFSLSIYPFLPYLNSLPCFSWFLSSWPYHFPTILRSSSFSGNYGLVGLHHKESEGARMFWLHRDLPHGLSVKGRASCSWECRSPYSLLCSLVVTWKVRNPPTLD